MRVRVLFFGVLKDLVGCAEDTLDVAPQSTLASVFDAYAQRFATLRDKRSSILLARNREFSRPETVLHDNDEVAFLPPVSGGADSGVRQIDGNYFAITREPIDSKALVATLKRTQDGAVVIFEGVVRDHTKGRATSYLEYDSYEEMALNRMTQIGEQVLREFQIGRIGIIHRLGRLAIGEASVAIVATAPHRRAAFEAALAAIDRLKREVPIWKKEIFADGAEWVEGEWDSALVSGASKHDGS